MEALGLRTKSFQAPDTLGFRTQSSLMPKVFDSSYFRMTLGVIAVGVLLHLAWFGADSAYSSADMHLSSGVCPVAHFH